MRETDPLIRSLSRSVWILLCCTLGVFLLILFGTPKNFDENSGVSDKRESFTEASPTPKSTSDNVWQAPDTATISFGEDGDLIRYGRDLIAHTAVYLGPEGKAMSISNGMNCQNCHLEAGTVPYGNNFGAVASKYPLLRGRSGLMESIEMRINDCLERSLNGQALENDSREMRAMAAYLKWVGKDVDKNDSIAGIGLLTPALLDRPADPIQGRVAYIEHCSTCHGEQGEGLKEEDEYEWTYPPLFGPSSYNTGAGLYRLSRFAAYIKSNMPFGTTFDVPVLTDEEAWDIAAYVNSMPRPHKDFPQDWPDKSKKPFDHPFGPFADDFSEAQHKFGPFKQIQEAR